MVCVIIVLRCEGPSPYVKRMTCSRGSGPSFLLILSQEVDDPVRRSTPDPDEVASFPAEKEVCFVGGRTVQNLGVTT